MPGRKPGAAFWKRVCHPRPARPRLPGVGGYQLAGHGPSITYCPPTDLAFSRGRGGPSLSKSSARRVKTRTLRKVRAAVPRGCRSPPGSWRKPCLPEGEQRFPRTATSCRSPWPALRFGSVFPGVGHKLGTGSTEGRHPRVRGLLGTTLTVARAPAAPSFAERVRATAQKQETRPRLGHLLARGARRSPDKEARARSGG